MYISLFTVWPCKMNSCWTIEKHLHYKFFFSLVQIKILWFSPEQMVFCLQIIHRTLHLISSDYIIQKSQPARGLRSHASLMCISFLSAESIFWGDNTLVNQCIFRSLWRILWQILIFQLLILFQTDSLLSLQTILWTIHWFCY